MKKLYLYTIGILSLFFDTLSAQHELKVSVPGNFFDCVNNSGLVCSFNRIYNIEEETYTEDPNPNLTILSGINNNGDLTGSLAVGVTPTAGYKIAGQSWSVIPFPFPEAPQFGVESIVYSISNSGEWVVGLMPLENVPFTFNNAAFRYNTTTNTFEDLLSPNLPNNNGGNAFKVNDDGTIYGWVDENLVAEQVHRPAIFNDSGITLIGAPTASNGNFANSATSDGQLVVGLLNQEGFIFDTSTSQLTTFAPPSGFVSLEFRDIADNGLVIGIAVTQQTTTAPQRRDAVVYHPEYTNGELVFLRDFISESVPTLPDIPDFEDQLMGSARAISDNGVYIVGFGNLNPILTQGQSWAVKLDYALLSTSNTKKSNNNINLYPNPAIDQLYLESNESDFSLKIYERSGKLIYAEEFSNASKNVSLSHILPKIKNGNELVFVQIRTKNKTITKKLILR